MCEYLTTSSIETVHNTVEAITPVGADDQIRSDRHDERETNCNFFSLRSYIKLYY